MFGFLSEEDGELLFNDDSFTREEFSIFSSND
jgi:hypothetical protein